MRFSGFIGADGSMNTSIGGLDHSFCIDTSQGLPSRDPAMLALDVEPPPMAIAARLHDPESRRAMEIFTTGASYSRSVAWRVAQSHRVNRFAMSTASFVDVHTAAPAIQVHTANNIDGEVGLRTAVLNSAIILQKLCSVLILACFCRYLYCAERGDSCIKSREP